MYMERTFKIQVKEVGVTGNAGITHLEVRG